MNNNNIIEIIEKMTVLELSELVKQLEEKFGVSANISTATTASVTASEIIPNEIEQTEFDVILTNVGAGKINVIKVVREISGLGLKEAKEVVDNAPRAIKEKVSKSDAEAIKVKLVEAGASVEIK